MSCEELQEEELEVLQSIYDGDDCFKEVSKTSFQYKYGEDMHHRSFVLQIDWSDEYPEQMPSIHLEAFYNKHLIDEVKENMIKKIIEEAESMLGYAMTYSLFEFAKTNVEEFTEDQPEQVMKPEEAKRAVDPADSTSTATSGGGARSGIDMSAMTKGQKRKLYNRMGNMGTQELVRGWDWVDIVKHLSQPGRGEEQGNRPS